ncbi:unnamed protein product [Thlaspi arvense]|uniref:Uncharacterized protein n=1 Tax=Thlaspi arvense TaxID=13288 RepID=A0AAU9RQ87_THLAR|nr:unnamed protein product [Thlaspi arvense]
MAWTPYMVSTYCLCAPADFESKDYPYITRTENDQPQYTIEEKTYMINEQIDESEGFDIDYTFFQCLFKYRPVILNGDDFVEEPKTYGDLLRKLSQKSLECYNEEEGTKY